MKNLAVILSLLLASIAGASAQVTVEVAFDQEQFLPGETLMAVVKVTNRSGQTIKLGAEENWLRFEIESANGFVVSRTGNPSVQGEFTLESSKRAIKRVDLAPYFSLTKQGRYTVTASISLPAWKQNLTSPPKGFDIIQGARLWEQDFGVPKADGPPEVRKYVLQQANYLKSGLMLYFLLTDSNGKPIKVFPVGQLLSFGRPEGQVDKVSNLHLLYQDAPHAFSYTVFNPDGEIIARRKYDYAPTRPRLQVDTQGNIDVTGGTRRITLADVPAAKPDESNGKTTAP